jgi:polysaccharide deacetylase 2 family uncharacterized protein YibQ
VAGRSESLIQNTMRRDEFRQPLKRRSLRERLWAKRPSALQTASMAAALSMIAIAAWVVRMPHPYGGEPVVMVAIPPPEEIKTASTTPSGEIPEENQSEEAENQASPAAPVEIEVEPEQTVDTGTSLIVSTRRSLPLAPIAAVTEEGPYGPLPVIGRGNKRPSEVYARSVPIGITLSDAPKIAIVLGGMGLNAELTQKAIAELPGDITFAFAPYGDDPQPLVNKARKGGHEIILQVPMEPIGYPAANPGPKTLLASADKNANLDALAWHMGRFAGYAGVMNYMGGKLLSEPQALQPILSEIRRRGLFYLDDGTAGRSMAGQVAKTVGLRLRTGHKVIDANADPQQIAAVLLELEAEARVNGAAIGTGAGLEVTIEAVAQWAKTLNDKGIILVPLSATFKGRQT